jgi:pilus assembly protein CpaC
MNENNHQIDQWPHFCRKAMVAALGVALVSLPLTQVARAATAQGADSVAVSADGSNTEVGPQINLIIGKATILRLPKGTTDVLNAGAGCGARKTQPVAVKDDVSGGKRTVQIEDALNDDCVVDQKLLNPTELYLLGKKVGSTNIILWNKSGQSTMINVTVGMDSATLQAKLMQLLPGEKNIKVSSAADHLVLSGTVTSAMKIDKALAIAEAFVGGKKENIINMLTVSSQQQVMLEVTMAEVSKDILDKLGAAMTGSAETGGLSWGLATGFINIQQGVTGLGGGLVTITDGQNKIAINAEKDDGVVKVLAEPHIMAISGQEGSFLAGGTLFIPVTQSAGGVGATSAVTLEEKDFGIGLKFTPTVLEGDLINLKVAPEVSEPNPDGTQINSPGLRQDVLPSFFVRRASTTVQLHDGQSFAIAGLMKNNVKEIIKRVPGLGDLPIIGALFRSANFQSSKTELLFVITPRLVKPLKPNYALPTDNFEPPNSLEFFGKGLLEKGSDKEGTPVAAPDKAAKEQPAPQSDSSGYEMK